MSEFSCPACGALVYGKNLEQLSAEARWQEQFDPKHAINLWQQCMALLPAQSRQRQIIAGEINRLSDAAPAIVPTLEPGTAPPPRSDTLLSWWKTIVSMAISAAFYCMVWDWQTAVGFVLLILVHEMGHVIADIFCDVPASAPIFIPFLGAVINVRAAFRNARIEAICAIAGPIAGTIASLVCFGFYFHGHSPIMLSLAWFGFTMNLFNLLPVPPLDGGRVAAAMSPWIWLIGLAGMGLMIVDEFRDKREPGVLLLILLVAVPRIVQTLKGKGRTGEYYRIGTASRVAVSAAYLALLGCLIALRWYSQSLLPERPLI